MTGPLLNSDNAMSVYPRPHDDVHAMVRGVCDIASLPGACLRILELADDSSASVQDIEEVVSHDPGLSARTLKLVNSAYYSLPKKIDSMREAVRVVGMDALRNLALATGVESAFERVPNDLIDITTFWDTSIHCALSSRELCRVTHQLDPERGFIVGLLHGVGQLVMYNREPKKSRQVLDLIQTPGILRSDVERSVFGFTHAEAGAALLEAWRLPASLSEPIGHQLSPAEAPTLIAEAAVLHIAAALSTNARAQDNGVQSEESELLQVPSSIWRLAGLVPSVTEKVLDEVDSQWFEVTEILFPGSMLIRY